MTSTWTCIGGPVVAERGLAEVLKADVTKLLFYHFCAKEDVFLSVDR